VYPITVRSGGAVQKLATILEQHEREGVLHILISVIDMFIPVMKYV
jgi:hypothetical protein